MPRRTTTKKPSQKKAPAKRKPKVMSAVEFNEDVIKRQMKHEQMMLEGKKKKKELSPRERAKALQMASEEALVQGLKKNSTVVTPMGRIKRQAKRVKGYKKGDKYTSFGETKVREKSQEPYTKKVVKASIPKKLKDQI